MQRIERYLEFKMFLYSGIIEKIVKLQFIIHLSTCYNISAEKNSEIMSQKENEMKMDESK